jgi:N-formylglutamate amidohydrolase
VLAAFIVSAAAHVPATLSAQEKTLQPGVAYFDAEKYVEFTPGSLPIVLTSPHGGALKPKEVANRTEGVLGADRNTQELTREIQAEFLRRTGRPPHVIISLLHRSKLDPNREIKEAAQGDPRAEKAWHNFHNSIRAAVRNAVETHGFAFLIDIHGHGHEIDWVELGYGLSSTNLNQSDAKLDESGLDAVSTLNDIATAGHITSFAQVLRGPKSLGALLQARGYRVVPGPRDPGPGKNRYFNGGYIVRTYARDTKGVDGVQIEAHLRGVRDTPAERKAFAKALVDSMILFLEEHYRYAIVPASKASSGSPVAATP